MVSFTCTLCGRCCRMYWVPITHIDALRIADGTGLDSVDFTALYNAEVYESRMPKILLNGKTYFLGLKRRNDGYCVFNAKGPCTIHRFKPIVCRFYPFKYEVRNGMVRISILPEAVGFCPGLIPDDKPIPANMVAELSRLARIRSLERRLFTAAVAEWNEEQGLKTESREKLLDFLLDSAERDLKVEKQVVSNNLYLSILPLRTR